MKPKTYQLNNEEAKSINNPIVFFDGYCGLCNRFVDVIMDLDDKKSIRFSPLQGELSQRLNLVNNEKYFRSVILLDLNKKVYFRSSAAIRIVYRLGGFWKFFIVLLVIPTFIRDFFYEYVAVRRYKWFGLSQSCRIPNEQEAAMFIKYFVNFPYFSRFLLISYFQILNFAVNFLYYGIRCGNNRFWTWWLCSGNPLRTIRFENGNN